MTVGRVVKGALRRTLGTLVTALGGTRVGQILYQGIIDTVITQTRSVSHNGVRLILAVPNEISHFRADTFAGKEPETLRWIDAIPEGSVLWDIGANVGLYSCYAAKARRCRVFAFEPSVFNLELLARNAFLNGLADNVIIVPLPLGKGLGVNRMRMSSTQWGGALSTFGEDFGFDGRPLQTIFEFQTLGMSMSDATMLLGIPQPDFIKMDVDGIEHLILAGGEPVLRSIRSILVEINEDFREQAEAATDVLRRSGLALREKHRWAEAASPDSQFQATYNQIWWRESPT